MNRNHNDTKKRMLEQHTESRRIPVSGFRFQVSQQASSLITTLLVLVVLSTVVVAFMQSMSVERNVARSIMNRTRAEQAAEAGLSAATSSLQVAVGTNYSIAQDRTSPSPADWQTIVLQLSAAGVATNTNYVERPASQASLGSTRKFDFGLGYQLTRTNYALTNSAGETNASYAYAILDNAAKQNLDRYTNLPRGYATTIRELPLISTNGAAYSSSDLAKLTNFAAAGGVNWIKQLLTVPTIKQFLPSSSENPLAFFDTSTWSTSIAPNGSPKIDLRRLKYYVDSLSSSQAAAGNPKSLVVDALVGVSSTVDPVAKWGGGTLSWLTNAANPNKYTLTQAKQIAANLVDYLDDDLHPTTDNIDSPTYLGVEGRLQANGKVLGHPYITATGFGLVFNFSAASGSQGWLNSTRVLAYWSLINPWSAPISYSTFYTPEIEIEIRGTASGGLLGTDAQYYFLKPLDQQLTGGPSQLAANTGSTYPNDPSGLSYANLYSLQPSNRQPKSMQFTNLRFVIKKMRLKFTDASGISSYVQVLDMLNPVEVPMNPPTFTLPAPSGGSTVYNPGTVKKGLFLTSDPRLGFQPNSWIQADLASAATSTNPPQATPRVSMFSKMDSTNGDGMQGLPTDETWYSTNATTNHFFVRSSPVIANNPATTPYNPDNAPDGLAVDSIAEIGYLWSGLPWQTLRMVETNTTSTRADYRMLDFIDSGTMPRTTNAALQVLINGKVNPNTAPDRTLRSVFSGIPGLSSAAIDSVITNLRTISSSPYPFATAGMVGQNTNLQSPGSTFKFAREDLMRRVANTLTTSPNVFTVFVIGEARDPRNPAKVFSRVNLSAVVQLTPIPGGGTTSSILSKTFY